MSSVSEESMDGAEEAVERIMLNRLTGDEDAFTIQKQSDIMAVSYTHLSLSGDLKRFTQVLLKCHRYGFSQQLLADWRQYCFIEY